MTTITTSDLMLMAHAGFGVTGCIAAALPAAACMAAAWIYGGFMEVKEHLFSSPEYSH